MGLEMSDMYGVHVQRYGIGAPSTCLLQGRWGTKIFGNSSGTCVAGKWGRTASQKLCLTTSTVWGSGVGRSWA